MSPLATTIPANPMPNGAPMTETQTAVINVTSLEPHHVDELRAHADKLRWQMTHDERPAPPHGWTCFHCAQTFTTWASASAHFGDDPRAGRPECITTFADEKVRAAAQALLNATREQRFPASATLAWIKLDAALATAPAVPDGRTEEVEKLHEALADLVSWFDGGPHPYGPWIIKAGDYGADGAVEAARAALSERRT